MAQEETIIEVQTPKSLFQLLEDSNNRNVELRKPTILGTAQDVVANTMSIFAGTVEGVAKGMELANSYISEELDRQVASRTETKVDTTIRQFEAIARLTALGCPDNSAIQLATSYRR